MRFHVIAINESTGRRERLTSSACTHDEACNILRKLHPRPRAAKHVRVQLEEVVCHDRALAAL